MSRWVLRWLSLIFTVCLACSGLAVIVQQIWYRYFHGQTSNPRIRAIWADHELFAPTLPTVYRRIALMAFVYLIRHGQAGFGTQYVMPTHSQR